MRVLLVEDEASLAKPLLALLQKEGYQAVWAADLEEAQRALADGEPDLITLDVMLPEGEEAGFEFAEGLRRVGFRQPILFLTARDAVEDRVRGLDLGGDDYLTKPFALQEFLARLRALARREAYSKQDRVERGPLWVDLPGRRAGWADREAPLTEREFDLLEVMVRFPDKVFTVDELLDRFFPEVGSGSKILRVYVHRLRDKLHPQVIVTVPGGYRLGV